MLADLKLEIIKAYKGRSKKEKRENIKKLIDRNNGRWLRTHHVFESTVDAAVKYAESFKMR